MTDRRCGWLRVEIGDPKPTGEDPAGLLHFTTEPTDEPVEEAEANVQELRRGRRPRPPSE